MGKQIYFNIFQKIILLYPQKEIPLNWAFQQGNYPNQTDNQNWFLSNNIKVEEWPVSSPDLNPIKNLWSYINKEVSQLQPTYYKVFWTTIQHIQHIPKERSQNPLNSQTKRCEEVISNKAHAERQILRHKIIQFMMKSKSEMIFKLLPTII